MFLFALGLIVGLVLALTGAGGTIIAVPLLMFGMGWTLTQASPVALAAVACSAAVGTIVGLRAGIVRYRAALLMAACGMVTMPLGLYGAHHLPLLPLTLAFSALLLGVAVRTFLQARAPDHAVTSSTTEIAQAPCLIDPRTGRFRWTDRCGRALSAAGLGTGLLSGLFGVGGGFLIVPALRRVTDLSIAGTIATSTMVIGLVSASTAITAAIAGHLPGFAAAWFAAGAVGGMLVGRLVATRITGPRLQQGFAVLTAGAAVAVAVRALVG
ncbi:hypothetical protein DFR24_4450 [Panacagrimonas perspica]|uniref:Probable membrane transporter protein n=1 Tax=Panacagrimonas perspica TaxID=381431 RepID=A0A4V3F5G7_9GAMM|nr:sulfite exporter TauE/SafE family protein [Panacagrimonas perspica]TDU24186.1 hypothetical protein DFR24_4450 [Panacagrimonas perspica]THD04597.1 hypothetical protein B1810_04045 [Panacagrimonas perspica]